MVAISMYRGNLHKVSDVPRRWPMPEHNLSIKDFKSLLHRRKQALARISLNSNPSVNLPNVKNELVTDQEDMIPPERLGSSGEKNPVEVKRDEEEKPNVFEGTGVGGSDDGDHSGRVEVILKKEADDIIPHEDGKSKVGEKPVDTVNEKAELKETAEVPNEVQKRRKEVEERLQVLNTKKHNLVQILKQILNAEEELKRRSNVVQQGMTATRPSLPLHVDVSNDSGSNPGEANMEVGETNDAANQSTQSRTALRLCGASSSSESPLIRAAAFARSNMVPHPSRGSPRVGPSQPGNPALAAVTVSATGTNYIASSPSPAGSGGTSVFRESKLQSPRN